jgi:hypothetical protein
MTDRDALLWQATADDLALWQRWRREARGKGWDDFAALRLAFRRWVALREGALPYRPPVGDGEGEQE